MKTRKEYDSIGGINVPVDKYWVLLPKDQKNFLILENSKLDRYLLNQLQ